MTEPASRLCRNCGEPFVPVHRLAAPIEGFEVPEGYQFGPSRIWYCRSDCRDASRRKRDRERKRERNHHIGLIPRSPFQDNGPNALKTLIAACRQCGKVGQLRLDTYGPALDDYLDVDPEFCSVDCVVDWWKSRPGERPDVSIDIARLLGLWDANAAKAEREFRKAEFEDELI